MLLNIMYIYKYYMYIQERGLGGGVGKGSRAGVQEELQNFLVRKKYISLFNFNEKNQLQERFPG